MTKAEKQLARVENEVRMHTGCRIKFYYQGAYHMGRIESCYRDTEHVWIWTTPADPALCNPWPRLKLTAANVAEILDNPHGYSEQTVSKH